MALSQNKLVSIMKSLFNEDEEISKMIVELLLTEKRQIDFNEILSAAKRIEKEEKAESLAVEASLAMEYWKLMLPARTKHQGSIQWSNRLNRPKPGEKYEVPPCIAFAFKRLMSEGIWNWKLAVKDYLDEIKEPNQQVTIDVVEDLVKNAYLKRFVSKALLENMCKQHNYPKDADVLIAELKAGGVISPCVEYSLFSRKIFEKFIKDFSKTGPLYELNRALFILELRE